MNCMEKSEIYNSIKSIVWSYLPNSKVLLFGSGAINTNAVYSDYDLLIITPNEFPARDKITLEIKISKSLIYAIHSPFDVILESLQGLENKRNAKGLIFYHALKDGIEL